MSLLVDTSVWSLALRCDAQSDSAEVEALAESLEAGDPIFSTGLVLQELLQGFRGPRARQAILERFSALPFVQPERLDHIAAAALQSDCRRRGIQVGTIDALLAQLCIRFGLTLLTTDQDFQAVARHHRLRLWRG